MSDQSPASRGSSGEGDADSAAHSRLAGALHAMMECPVCYGPLAPRAFQCPAGHLVCFSCARSLARCATCRRPMPSLGVRCLAVEQLASMLPPRACGNPGCTALVGWSDALAHQEECPHQEAICPMAPHCQWSGSVGELCGHLDAEHMDSDLGRLGGRGVAERTDGDSAVCMDVRITNPQGLRYEFGWRGLLRVDTGRWAVLHARTTPRDRGPGRGGAYLCFFIQAVAPPAACASWRSKVSVHGASSDIVHSVSHPCWSVCTDPATLARDRRSVLHMEMDHALRMGGGSRRMFEEDMLDLATDPSELALSCRFEVNFEDGPFGVRGLHGFAETGAGVGVETAVEMSPLEDTAPTTQAATANEIMAAVRENA